MLYITQLIYIHEGEEQAFFEFESKAIPFVSKYNGELLLRIRPNEGSLIEIGSIEKPYEVHLVRFNSAKDFKAFQLDEERKRFLHLKEKSIRVSMLIQGERI